MNDNFYYDMHPEWLVFNHTTHRRMKMKMLVNYFQNAKSDFVRKTIQDETLATVAHNYIKAQTAFAHMVIDNTETIMKHTFDTMTKVKKDEQ